MEEQAKKFEKKNFVEVQNKLTLNLSPRKMYLEKCLRHTVTRDAVAPDTRKVKPAGKYAARKAVREIPSFRCTRQLQRMTCPQFCRNCHEFNQIQKKRFTFRMKTRRAAAFRQTETNAHHQNFVNLTSFFTAIYCGQ